MFQQRRKMEGRGGSGQKKSIVQEINKKAFRCMDELNDNMSDDDDDEQCNSDNENHEVGESKHESTVIMYKNASKQLQTEIDGNEASFKIEQV